jgi:hypothetical protein
MCPLALFGYWDRNDDRTGKYINEEGEEKGREKGKRDEKTGCVV